MIGIKLPSDDKSYSSLNRVELYSEEYVHLTEKTKKKQKNNETEKDALFSGIFWVAS